MSLDWYELTELTNNQPFTVKKVQLKNKDICVEGNFELPPLAELSFEDQVFIAEFIKVHGSIKQMEQMFGVSYPTIKSKLNKISKSLNFIKISEKKENEDALSMLENGKLSVEEALERLKK